MAQKKLEIVIERNDGLISLKIKLPTEIEELFKKLSDGETQTSEKWFAGNDKNVGSVFYKLKDNYTEIERRLNDLGLRTYNDFGDGLSNVNKINLATLRVVGASGEGGVELFAKSFNDSGIDMEFYVRELSIAVKYLWQEFIGKKELKAVITYEI